MSIIDDIRRQKRIRAAEGYLDLITVFSNQWDLEPSIRDPIAQRAVRELVALELLEGPNGYTHFLRGQALRAMGHFQEAIPCLQLALEDDPENMHVLLALGWCYKRTKRLDLAIQALEEAMGENPEEAILHYNLACYWALAKNTRLALRYLNQSFDLDPNYRDMALNEPDFDPIRKDPGFQSLMTVIV